MCVGEDGWISWLCTDPVEAERGCHTLGQASGQFSNGILDVVEVCVAGPSAQFFNHVVIISVQFEVHGSAGSETVGTDSV